MLLLRERELYPKQYGLGLRVYRDMRGNSVFSTIKRFARPVGKYLFRNILKPFFKNNKEEIKRVLSKQSMNIIKKLAQGKRPATDEIVSDIKEILTGKTLSEHMRGEGLCGKRRKLSL